MGKEPLPGGLYLRHARRQLASQRQRTSIFCGTKLQLLLVLTDALKYSVTEAIGRSIRVSRPPPYCRVKLHRNNWYTTQPSCFNPPQRFAATLRLLACGPHFSPRSPTAHGWLLAAQLAQVRQGQTAESFAPTPERDGSSEYGLDAPSRRGCE